MRNIDTVSGDGLDLALRVHRELGPGLLKNVYEVAMAGRLTSMDYAVASQKPVGVVFDGSASTRRSGSTCSSTYDRLSR